MAEIDSTHDTTGREAFEEAYIKEKLRIIGGNSPASVEKAVRAVMLRRNEDGDYDNSREAYFSWWAWRHQAARIARLEAQVQELRDASQRAHDWMERQARAQSKGCHATFDLMMLREERDALAVVLDAARAAKG